MSDLWLPARQRISRALEIAASLRSELAEYLETNPTHLEVRGRAPGGSELVLRVDRQPPARLAFLLGEYVHQIRANLDNMVLTLAEQGAGRPLAKDEERGLQFPIIDDPGSFARRMRTKPMALLGNSALEAIRDMQPFAKLRYLFNDEDHGLPPQEQPLSVLVRLSNCDKHRRLTVLTQVPDRIAIGMLNPGDPGLNYVGARPLFDGDVIALIERDVAFELLGSESIVMVEVPGGRLSHLDGLLAKLDLVGSRAYEHLTGERFAPVNLG